MVSLSPDPLPAYTTSWDSTVLDALPQSFDEHIILPASLPVHADLDPIGFQQAGEGITCELASLICVEYLRRAVASQGFFERLHAEVCVHCDRYPPGQHLAAMPVHHCG